MVQFKVLELKSMNLILLKSSNDRFKLLEDIFDTNLKVSYIDIDLVATGYIKSNLLKPTNLELYIIEDQDGFEDALASILARLDKGIIVLDSFDGFELIGIRSNHLISIYLALLAKHAKSLGSKVLIISKRIRWFLAKQCDLILNLDYN